jgi:hypothetical protein
MNDKTTSTLADGLTVVGACAFIVVLAVSAYWERDIRWLHFFQAWMYIATVVGSVNRNRWGYFIGISAAGLWDVINIVATTFFRNGLEVLVQWARTGHLVRPDLLIAVPACFSNLIVLIGCSWAYSGLPRKSLTDVAGFVAAFAVTTGFFAAVMAIFQARFLPLLCA